MNKNKKITILMVAALCATFATGCGNNVEKTQEEIKQFVESHNKITAAILRDGIFVGLDSELGDMGLDLNIDLEKDLVLNEVMKEEKANLKSIKSKELKKMNKTIYGFYDENSNLMDKLIDGKMDLDEYTEKLDELGEDYVKTIDKEHIKGYDKLRVKAEMDEIEEYDAHSHSEQILEIFKDEYVDDLEKVMINAIGSNAMSALSQLANNAYDNSNDKEALNSLKDFNQSFGDDNKDETSKNESSVDKTEDVKDTPKASSNAEACKNFLNSIAKSSSEKNEMYVSDSGDFADIEIEGSKGGHVKIGVMAEDGRIDDLSIDMYTEGDEEEFEGRIKEAITSFCKDTGIPEKAMLKKIQEVYDETSSDKFINSDQAQKDIKDYDFVPNHTKFNDDIDISMYLHNPNSKYRDEISIDISIYDFSSLR